MANYDYDHFDITGPQVEGRVRRRLNGSHNSPSIL
jgi:hypothetical protein